MLPVYFEVEYERQRDEEHQRIGGEIKGCLDIGVVLEGGTLIVWRWLRRPKS